MCVGALRGLESGRKVVERARVSYDTHGAEGVNYRVYFFFYFSTKTSAAEISPSQVPKLQIFQACKRLMAEAAEAPLCDTPMLHTGELVVSDAAATAH